MGVLNTTPDSFSDGGRYLDPEAAVAHGLRLAAEGADLVDVGGESTRPGAARVDPDEERARVLPVVAALSAAGVRVSVDTMRAGLAAEAVDAGAVLVNDVSGGLADPEMFATVARLEVPYVLMHWRGHSTTMQEHADYDDVVADVRRELESRVDAAAEAGVDPDRVCLDPGIGFAKTAAHNWAVLHGLAAIHQLGLPVLVATSRKRFLGELLRDGETLRAPVDRDDATTATATLAAVAGAWCVRVHAVRATADAVRVAARWAEG
ncbi:dihydropteroate synthase [Nocardioides marmoribigeumensis]|nr:dihydropteroate synthase [Nocardioides marmoribigeumensis]